MSRKQATILLAAESGHTGKIVLPGCSTLVAAQAFLTSIQSAYMDAVPMSISVSETTIITDSEIDGGNTDRKAIILYKDAGTSTTKRISIPGWGTDVGDSEMTPEGERVPLVACQSVIEALETATGGDFVAVEGYIVQTK